MTEEIVTFIRLLLYFRSRKYSLMCNTFCLFASSLSCYTYMSICLLKSFKRNLSRNDHVNFSSSHLIAMCKKPLANFQLQVDKQKPWHWTCDFIVIMLYTQRRVHWHFDPHRPLPETVRFLTISPQALQNVNHFDAFHCKHWDVEMPVTHFLEQHTDSSHISFELFLSESARERRWTNCSQRWILSKYMRTSPLQPELMAHIVLLTKCPVIVSFIMCGPRETTACVRSIPFLSFHSFILASVSLYSFLLHSTNTNSCWSCFL